MSVDSIDSRADFHKAVQMQVDRHDFASAKSRNDRKNTSCEKLDSSTNATTLSSRAFEKGVAIQPFSPSLRGEAQAIHKKVSNPKVDCHEKSSDFSRNDKKLDSMDCHATATALARNDKILDSANDSTAQNLSDSAQDSRICDDKSGLCEHSQGRALGVRNRSEREAIADLSRKAESISDKPPRTIPPTIPTPPKVGVWRLIYHFCTIPPTIPTPPKEPHYDYPTPRPIPTQSKPRSPRAELQGTCL